MSVTVEKCLQAWTNSLRQMNAKADIVFFGDSLTYYGDFASVFPDKVVCNLGLRGDTIQGMIERVEQIRILEPKVIFLMAGINDIAKLSIEKFKDEYILLVNTILNAISESKLFVQSILPVNSLDYKINIKNKSIERYNYYIKGFANNNRIQFVDLFFDYIELNNFQLSKQHTIDGIHLQNDAYLMWYKKIASILK